MKILHRQVKLLAGALQDNDKGTIVGRRSFGKGLGSARNAVGRR